MGSLHCLLEALFGLCMRVYMHVCMHAYIHTRMHIYLSGSTSSTRTHTYNHTYIHTYIPVGIDQLDTLIHIIIAVYMFCFPFFNVRGHLCMYVCVCVYVFMYTHMCVYIHIIIMLCLPFFNIRRQLCMYMMYVCVCMYLCVYTYISSSPSTCFAFHSSMSKDICVCMYICVSVCMHICFTHTHTHTHKTNLKLRSIQPNSISIKGSPNRRASHRIVTQRQHIITPYVERLFELSDIDKVCWVNIGGLPPFMLPFYEYFFPWEGVSEAFEYISVCMYTCTCMYIHEALL